ncbi:MAG TPA: hypothetical protein VM264_07410 [Acidimicrobiales bacterium]|nr:hypothetical protein [Acidimicrobiales bacterium]
MPVDAFVHLDTLRCIAEHDGNGHSEPYAWTVLLWVDDTTITSGELVGSSAPGNASARLVAKAGIRPGDAVAMPTAQRRFGHRFEDGLDRRQIAIVVALFEEDELPARAVRAGYDVFVDEVPRAVADFALSHGGNAPETDAERQEVADAVRPKVESAIRGALSNFEKFQIAIGSLDVDDQIGFSAASAKVDDGDRAFTLRFEKTVRLPPPFNQEITNHYEIDGRFEFRLPPPPDRCQAEVEGLNAARAAVSGLQAQIAALQAELQSASPAEKPFLIAEIRRVRTEELPDALAALERATRALEQCRSRPGRGGVIFDPPDDLIVVEDR